MEDIKISKSRTVVFSRVGVKMQEVKMQDIKMEKCIQFLLKSCT